MELGVLSLSGVARARRALQSAGVGHCIVVAVLTSHACTAPMSLTAEMPQTVPHDAPAHVVYAPNGNERLARVPPEEAEPSRESGSSLGLEEHAIVGFAPEAAIAQEEDLVFWVPTAWPRGATVLHIGDSFAGALGKPLNSELGKRGVRGILKYRTGTYIATWAWNRRVPGYVSRYRPDLVLITLGANELDVARPESRGNAIRRLVQALGQRPCVWIAPPLWEGARGDLLRVIQDNCAPCQYLDSNELVPNLARLGDKIHPTGAARSRWAKAVMSWLELHPIGQLEQSWVSLDQHTRLSGAARR